MISRKSIRGVSVLMSLSLFLGGCVLGERELIPVDTATPTMTMEKMIGNSLTFEHDVDGNKITTSYNLGDYRLENWRITDSKSVSISLGASSIKEGTEILVEHVHSDVSIKSTDPQLNGLTQDTMDNSYHGTSQDGFWISEKHPYTNIFAIEGFSKDFISGYSAYVSGYGGGSVSSNRFTEAGLLRSGAYGSQISVIWNLLVKDSGDDKYHIKTIEDRIIVPTMAFIQYQSQPKEQMDAETNR